MPGITLFLSRDDISVLAYLVDPNARAFNTPSYDRALCANEAVEILKSVSDRTFLITIRLTSVPILPVVICSSFPFSFRLCVK